MVPLEEGIVAPQLRTGGIPNVWKFSVELHRVGTVQIYKYIPIQASMIGAALDLHGY